MGKPREGALHRRSADCYPRSHLFVRHSNRSLTRLRFHPYDCKHDSIKVAAPVVWSDKCASTIGGEDARFHRPIYGKTWTSAVFHLPPHHPHSSCIDIHPPCSCFKPFPRSLVTYQTIYLSPSLRPHPFILACSSNSAASFLRNIADNS